MGLTHNDLINLRKAESIIVWYNEEGYPLLSSQLMEASTKDQRLGLFYLAIKNSIIANTIRIKSFSCPASFRIYNYREYVDKVVIKNNKENCFPRMDSKVFESIKDINLHIREEISELKKIWEELVNEVI